MKNITVMLCLLFFTICSTAQGPQNGSVAPDFTVTDINGNTHNLYSYLDAGKSCIIEMGGVYCAPSWKYHSSGQMSDFYNAYGPSGSDEVVVLWIENSTWISLYDLQTPTDNQSFGDWVTGTPFPMILNQAVYNMYSSGSVPKFYRICPDRILTAIPMPSPSSCRNSINSGCNSLTGVQNYARVLDAENQNGFCGSTGKFEARLRNYGTNNITSAVLNLKENGVIVSTSTFSGVIPQFSTVTVQFDEVTINPAAVYTVELETVNETVNFNDEFSVAALPFHFSNPTGKEIRVKVHTHGCPQHIKWTITNSSGTFLYENGPYPGGGGTLCGGPYANSFLSRWVTLPDVADCYDLTLMAANGLGWKNYEGLQNPDITPGIEVFSEGNLVYSNLSVGNFGSTLTIKNFLTVNGELGIEDTEAGAFTIYPNPASGIINFRGKDILAVDVFDMTGKKVFHSENISDGSAINLSHLGNGIYIIKATGTNNEVTNHKLILEL